MIESSKRLPEFEILRTISIVLLLIHHSGFYNLHVSLESLSPYFEAFLLGSFFFISGYFMEISLQKSDGNLIGFIKSRFLKIYPPYLVAFALYIFVLGISFKERFDLLVYLFGAQFIFSPAIVKPLITLWYVGAILLFYVIFLLLWKLASKTISLILSAFIIFALVYLLHQNTGFVDVRFFKYYFVFFTGMLLARQNESGNVLSSYWIVSKSVLALLGIAVFSWVVNLDIKPVSPLYILSSYIFIVSTTVLLFTILARFSVPFPWRWVTGVSYASYFIYLFHRPFWKIAENLFAIEELQHQILFRTIPASIVVVIICYFLQRGYDSMIAMLKGKRPELETRVSV